MAEISNPQPIRFKATLTREPDSSATFLAIPFNVFEVFGSRARVPVIGTINGFPYKSTISPYGGVHYLGVNRQLREGAGLKAGDIVEIEMAVDTGPRFIVPPEDLSAALEVNIQARKNWKKLSYSHQKQYVDALEEAKKPETRVSRIQKTIQDLSKEKKN
jgi:bifunctional DNA-binding transcriptional regulator/antitoxin component of YhaV-PrlF toxin-antitoxin module